MMEINKYKLSGCSLLYNDMLYHVKKYGVIYVGFLSKNSICKLRREINNILERESIILDIKEREVYYDDNENILRIT